MKNKQESWNDIRDNLAISVLKIILFKTILQQENIDYLDEFMTKKR